MFSNKPLFKIFFLEIVFSIIVVGCVPSAQVENTLATLNPEPSKEVSNDRQLEIFTRWTSPAEREALQALVDIYKQQNPEIEVINFYDPGLSGPDLQAIFDDRLQKQQPFDVGMFRPGNYMRWYVNLGQLEPLTQLFYDQGLDHVMPAPVIEQMMVQGEIYVIPLNIHRSNVLWYNPKIFDDNHLAPPETMEDFFEAAETLQNKGIIPLALGGKFGFEVAHLFESVLLATFGPEDYQQLFLPDTKMWEDPRTLDAIHTLRKMLAYTNANHLEIDWVDAAQMVLDGKAAMTVMGDWAEGFFKSQGAVPDQDFGWIVAPGTRSTYIWHSDGFGLPTGAHHREAALAWLEIVGSNAGQNAFNLVKGSIPVRTDADKRLYSEYQQWSIGEFASDILVPSAVYDMTAPTPYVDIFCDALADFSVDGDDARLQQALKAAVPMLAP